jgi:hypothetical protein
MPPRVREVGAMLLHQLVVEPQNEQRRRPLAHEHAGALLSHHLERCGGAYGRDRGPEKRVGRQLGRLRFDGLRDLPFGMFPSYCGCKCHV